MLLRWAKAKESRAELIKYLKYADQPSKLTSKMNYSNTMYAVAGEAAARVAGVPYEEFVTTKVFEPLSLTNTGFSQSELQQFSDYALPYNANSFENAKEGTFIRGELIEDYLRDAPAGDIYSNVLDLVRWGRALLKGGEVDGKQTLNKESIAETWAGRTFAVATRRSPDFAPVQAYGLGWAIDAYKGHAKYTHGEWDISSSYNVMSFSFLFHLRHAVTKQVFICAFFIFFPSCNEWIGGLITGYTSGLDIYPDLDLVVAVLANVNKTALTEHVSHYILDELLDLPRTQDWLFGVSPQETKEKYTMAEMGFKGQLPKKIENRPPVHALKEYAGVYNHLAHGDISIVYNKTEDALYFKHPAFESKLEHYHFELFKCVLNIFMNSFAIGVQFETDANGMVGSLKYIGPGYGGTVFERKVIPTAAKEE